MQNKKIYAKLNAIQIVKKILETKKVLLFDPGKSKDLFFVSINKKIKICRSLEWSAKV